MDEEKEQNSVLEEVSLEEILELQSQQQAEREEKEKLKTKVLKERGITHTSEVQYDDNY